MKKTLDIVIRIEYDENNATNYMSMEEIQDMATRMVVHPNFDARYSGVEIKGVQGCVVNADKIIDWDKLRHNPDFICVK